MNTKRKIFSIILVVVFIINLIMPWAQATALAQNIQTLKIEDRILYDALCDCFRPSVGNNYGALKSKNDGTQTLELDLDFVKFVQIEKVDMRNADSWNIVKCLVDNSGNLKILKLQDCNLSGVDFSFLNRSSSLTTLCMVNAGIDRIPDFKIQTLKVLNLSQNDLSDDGACDSLTEGNLPNLTCLRLDDCKLWDIGFLGKMGKLNELSLGKNLLTDESVNTLKDMSGKNLSGLQILALGKKVHQIDGISMSGPDIYNSFTNLANLALLPSCFSQLEDLELSGLRITSLKEFANVRGDITIHFDYNRINDFTGFEEGKKFTLNSQKISLDTNLAVGRSGELPELLKRILDANDVLKGTLEYRNCSLSDDGGKLFIPSDLATASVNVKSGVLGDTTISFRLKKIPDYTVPQGLTATVGDTLADVILPDGFAWRNPALPVGTEGTNIFQGIYTPEDRDQYIVIDDVEIPVTVKAAVAEPPQQTQKPESTQKPEPTQKPEQTQKPEPTQKPEQTHTPEPIQSSEPTRSPEPPKSTQSPESPEPTQLPEPTKSAELTKKEKKEQKKRELVINAQLKVRQVGNKISIKWGRVPSADGYDVYVQYCSKKFNAKSITAVKNGKTTKTTVRKVNGKKLNVKNVYKVYVRAYRLASGKKVMLAKTITAHIVGSKNTKYTNVKAVKVKKSSYEIKKGKSETIKASTLLVSKKKKKLTNEHAREFRYATTNPEVATVSKKGKIKAVGKGSCFIYVYARNGYAKKVKVKVK